MHFIYPAIFTPYEDKTGGYVVEFPDLPGCVTGGDDIVEAIFMAEDAASGWMLVNLEDGNDVPTMTDFRKIKIVEGQFINLIKLDMDYYLEKYGKQSIKKTLTIPAWLNEIGIRQNVNFSQVLQDALIKKLKFPRS